MDERIWYRSLYWRIALGFVMLLAVLLTIQGLVTLWMAGRVADLLPGRTPAVFAQALAAEVGVALAADADQDLEAFIAERYDRAPQAFAIATRDGRVILSARVQAPPMAARTARGALLGGGGGGRFRGAGGRGGPGRGGQAFELAPVEVNGETAAMVAVPAEPPPLSTVLRGFGPALAAVGFVLLLIGSAAAALLVFRPAHRRLTALEQAARALGAGASPVHAPDAGGDEVASLARTFNQMAADLNARSAALAEADRTRRQLLADISHELATPLAAISGYAETLGMPDVKLDEATRRRYLQVINDETDRVSHIVGDLLDLARLEGGGTPLRREPVSIDALFERVEQRHEPALQKAQVTMTHGLEENLPPLEADPPRLEQALQNLAANAIRHTPAGGTVHLRARRDGDWICLAVDDSGPGIPEAHLPRVFDRFYKVDASRTGTPLPSGSGLGLSIVRAIVAGHGGEVTVVNRPEGGARFEIRLPASPRPSQV